MKYNNNKEQSSHFSRFVVTMIAVDLNDAAVAFICAFVSVSVSAVAVDLLLLMMHLLYLSHILICSPCYCCWSYSFYISARVASLAVFATAVAASVVVVASPIHLLLLPLLQLLLLLQPQFCHCFSIYFCRRCCCCICCSCYNNSYSVASF
jgi:hypothetical protein